MFSQNSNDTIVLNLGNSKFIIVNKNSEDDWDFTKEESEKIVKKKYFNAELLLGTAGYLAPEYQLHLPSDNKFMEINYARSRSFALNNMLKGLDVFNKRLYFSPGYGISWNNYFFNNPIQVLSSNDTTEFQPDSLTDFKKFKLRSTYFQVPIIIGIRLGNLNKKTVGLQLGCVAAYNIRSKIVSHFTENNTLYKTKMINDFNINPFKISIISRLSIGKFGVYAQYSVTTLFLKNKAPEVYPISIGLIFGKF